VLQGCTGELNRYNEADEIPATSAYLSVVSLNVKIYHMQNKLLHREPVVRYKDHTQMKVGILQHTQGMLTIEK
jgi:hypothetical protein